MNLPFAKFLSLGAQLHRAGAAGLFETVGNARAEAGLPPAELKDVSQAAATSVWAAVVADKDEIGGKYLEDVAVATVDDSPNPFADGVRLYALDGEKAKQLWAKSEQLVAAARRCRGRWPQWGNRCGLILEKSG